MIITVILLGGLVSLLLYYFWSLKSCYEYFKQRNIPGPTPKLFFGNYLSIWSTSSFHSAIEKWSRQYGSIYGIFEGTRPIYVVSDLNFLQEVYIKQFSIFHSRHINFLLEMLKSNAPNLSNSHGNQWRRQRHIINPTFTTAKLKMMIPLVNKCIKSLLNKLDENDKNEFNIFVLYKRLTMDVIWHCAFGIDTDYQNDIDNIYMRKSLACFAYDPEKMFTVRLTKLIPFLTPILIKIMNNCFKLINFLSSSIPLLMRNIEGLPQLWIFKQIENVIKQRLNSQDKRMDFLQLMLDSLTEQQIKDDENNELIEKGLTYKEVLMNSVVFLTNGYETTSIHIGYATYHLAKNLSVQKKLQDETDQHWGDENEIDYDIINNMEYLDMFTREVFRFHSRTHRVFNRECSESTIVCGHQIEKGSVVQPDAYAIHRSIDLWGPDDPNEFIPERHMIKRHPLAYMTFGLGPRNCIGMKFAVMELKVVLVNILHQYNILPGDNIEQGMKRRETLTLAPEGILIRIEKRSK